MNLLLALQRSWCLSLFSTVCVLVCRRFPKSICKIEGAGNRLWGWCQTTMSNWAGGGGWVGRWWWDWSLKNVLEKLTLYSMVVPFTIGWKSRERADEESSSWYSRTPRGRRLPGFDCCCYKIYFVLYAIGIEFRWYCFTCVWQTFDEFCSKST